MKYIKLPILWKDGDTALLEDLGIETSYEQSVIKEFYLMLEELTGFFADKDPRFTCIYLRNTEMVVNMPIDNFIELIDNIEK